MKFVSVKRKINNETSKTSLHPKYFKTLTKPTGNVRNGVSWIILACSIRLLIVTCTIISVLINTNQAFATKTKIIVFTVVIILVALNGAYATTLLILAKLCLKNDQLVKVVGIMSLIGIIYLGVLTFAGGLIIMISYKKQTKSKRHV